MWGRDGRANSDGTEDSRSRSRDRYCTVADRKASESPCPALTGRDAYGRWPEKGDQDVRRKRLGGNAGTGFETSNWYDTGTGIDTPVPQSVSQMHGGE